MDMESLKIPKGGTYKVRNEIETKRNETKRNQRKRNETKRNQRGNHRCNISELSSNVVDRGLELR